MDSEQLVLLRIDTENHYDEQRLSYRVAKYKTHTYKTVLGNNKTVPVYYSHEFSELAYVKAAKAIDAVEIKQTEKKKNK